MATAIKFCVDASEHEGLYGITLFVDDESEQEVLPCYRTLFRGAPGKDLNLLAEAFGDCHQNAMNSCMSGQISKEDFETSLEDSIEMAANLMIKYGFTSIEFDTISEDVLQIIFKDDELEEGTKVLS